MAALHLPRGLAVWRNSADRPVHRPKRRRGRPRRCEIVSGGLLACVAMPVFGQRATEAGYRSDEHNAAPLVDAYPQDARGGGETSGGYNQLCWAEHWDVLRDPAVRKDAIDRLQFLLLGDDVHVTVSGDLRLRMNLVADRILREGDGQRQMSFGSSAARTFTWKSICLLSRNWPKGSSAAAALEIRLRRSTTIWSSSSRSPKRTGT